LPPRADDHRTRPDARAAGGTQPDGLNPTMAEFAVAYSLFLLAHIVPAAPGFRGGAVRRLGRGAYLALYSAVSIALLVWLVSAALAAPTTMLWPTTKGLALVPIVVMPFAFILLAAGFWSPNPLSISWRRGGFVPERPGIVGITRHPVLWAFALWAFAHMIANGNLVAVALFGGLGVYAVLGFALADVAARRRLGAEAWAQLASRTSIVPFVAIARGRSRFPSDAATVGAVVLGLAVYLVFIGGGHQWLIGVDPLALLH
jgi:uncharacterized membrane protein